MQSTDRYHAAIRFLEGLSNLPHAQDHMKGTSDPSIYIKRMRYFLSLLGNPQKGFRYVHVTGTSGKGTVSTMVHEMLTASGKRVGLHTSPFASTSIEKVTVNGKYISPSDLADIVDTMKPAIDRAWAEGEWGGPSYFELWFAIALLYFTQQRCEWVVLEVGCGGMYDATNVIEKPVVTAITNIDLDHMHILGNTIEKIARDKAGIIKKGAAFFTTEPRAHLRKHFQLVCKKVGAEFMGIDVTDDAKESLFHIERNRALATAIGRYLEIPEHAIRRGIARTHLPCRFEIMQEKPLVIVDGAHNPAKMASTIRALSTQQFKKLHVVIAFAGNKDSGEMLAPLAAIADTIACTRFQILGRETAHPVDLARQVIAMRKRPSIVESFYDPHEALDVALARAGNNDCVLVTGSFFLSGELRMRWISEEAILAKRRSR